MSLIIATGSNMGESQILLSKAKLRLAQFFHLISASRVYHSQAVDYKHQPDFFNQVLEFSLPTISPSEAMRVLLEIETEFGRSRHIDKGPRTLDIDIIFWGLEIVMEPALIIPHPRWQDRSFVVKPLQELPFFKTIEKCFTIPKTFAIDASPIL
jgi:2-amino-4-hydroxy-6-hydroxymethyldihydropteridine diphosphokinase